MTGELFIISFQIMFLTVIVTIGVAFLYEIKRKMK